MKQNSALAAMLAAATILTACSAPTALGSDLEDTPIVSHGSKVTDHASLLAELNRVGAITRPNGELELQFFPVKGRVIEIDGNDTQVFEFASAAEADAQAALVGLSGHSVGTTMLTWVGTPNFFRAGRLIVLYVGDDPQTLNHLMQTLGLQFAGGPFAAPTPAGESPATPEPGATGTLAPDNRAAAIGPSTISGSVWADRCVMLGGAGKPATPSGGCVPDGRGGYRANGVWGEGERRLAAVVVALAPGACPGDATRTVTTTTSLQGAFMFGKLNAGTYCVSIDPSDPQNLANLMPGEWTFPAAGVGRVTVDLGPGRDMTGVNFGWDAKFNQRSY